MTNKIYPKNVLETLSKYMLVDGFDLVFDGEKSHGSYLYDSKHNKEYLDFFTFFASSPIGFNHPKMNNEEFIKKLERYQFINHPTLTSILLRWLNLLILLEG